MVAINMPHLTKFLIIYCVANSFSFYLTLRSSIWLMSYLILIQHTREPCQNIQIINSSHFPPVFLSDWIFYSSSSLRHRITHRADWKIEKHTTSSVTLFHYQAYFGRNNKSEPNIPGKNTGKGKVILRISK